MTWWRKTFGLDGVDLLIHVGVTLMLIGFLATSNGPEEMVPVIGGVSLVVLGIRRQIARRHVERTGLSAEEMTAERLGDLEQRMDELEREQTRVAELEERLDFAERLLAKASLEPRQLQDGSQ